MSRRPAQSIRQRIEALAKITDEPGRITRLFASPAMRRANELVASWMRAAGMEMRVDAIGNLLGHYAGAKTGAKIILIGSHLDTVRNAGKFDGPLGIILAIACVQQLHRRKTRLPFAIEIICFADEEGVRYQTAYLGSKVLAGCFDINILKRKDVDGISMAESIRKFGGNPSGLKLARLNPKQLLGYLEAHIEQGPVLEAKKLAVGIVTAIAGQSRCQITFTGRAGHAGTTPMKLRRDALCAAAEFILAAEKLARETAGLVATVGQIKAEPGASNVIPGGASLTLDVRHQKDPVRRAAGAALKKVAQRIARFRRTKLNWQMVQQTDSVPCSTRLSNLLARAAGKHQRAIIKLPSGAGHDAAVMGKITPAAMLFIRCWGGISHHPDESARDQDVQVALKVMNDFLQLLAKNFEEAIAKSSPNDGLI
jgi:allantoate deiminase